MGLRRVRFTMAGLGKLGAQAIMEALKHNRTLIELDISFNRIPIEGANFIAAGLRHNDTLKVLKVCLLVKYYFITLKVNSLNNK